MTLEELEKRLKTLEDLEAIRKLHHEYIFMLLNRQWDEIVDCFAEDATANIAHHGLRRGRAELEKLFKENISKMNAGKLRDAHFVVQPVINVEGSTASGYWLMYIMVADPETGKSLRWVQGRHDCEYVEIDGKWKFKSVKYTRPWPLEPESLPKD
jgi:ketosteroid isomerase-like protein